MKTKEEIIAIIKAEGEAGVEADEKYVDIYDEVIDDGLELAQLVYFEESNELLAYLLDEENNGYVLNKVLMSDKNITLANKSRQIK